MKKTIKFILMSLIVAAMILGSAVNVFAEDTFTTTATTESETTEIPLLVISASFDANGNGKDDFDPGAPNKLYADPENEFFGEEWAQVSADVYYDTFFGDRYSVANYYREMTLGKLYFVPLVLDVKKDSNRKDGCINVVVNQIHPSAYTKKYKGSESERTAFCRKTIDNIIAATDDYIDYKKLDKDGNGVLDATELLIVIMNAGPSQEHTGKSEGNKPRGYFAVWSTSQGTNVVVDGVRYGSAITNMGEYGDEGVLQTAGTPAHELCHNLGAEDIYARKVGASGNAKTPWPWVNWFSLMCSGNYSGSGATGGEGSTPTYLDPYQRIYLGWAEEVVVGEGEYTLYSTCTGKYKVLRINTPDPDEYYLVELRLKEGFEVNLSDKGTGGICVWHIDETTNRRYFVDGTACSNYMFNGTYHDPGIVLLPSYNYTYYGLPNGNNKGDPFFYAGAKSKHNLKFESMNYRSPLQAQDGTFGLNTYPSNWMGEQYYNIIIEPLDEPGQEMRIRITIDSRGTTEPIARVTSVDQGGTHFKASGYVDGNSGAEVLEYGFMISTSGTYDENVIKLPITSEGGFAETNDLLPDTWYFARMYITAKYGDETFEVYGMTSQFKSEKLEETTAETTVATTEATTEATTAEPAVTTEPEVTTVATTEATTEATTAPSGSKGGCGSTLGGAGVCVIAVAAASVALVSKKKKKADK